MTISKPAGIEISGPAIPGADEVLTDEALAFVADLQRRFGRERVALLEARQERQAELDAGVMPDFPLGTADIRVGDWLVAPAPADLERSACRDHRPGRAEDDDQRAQLGRPRLHGRSRGRALADLGERRRRPGGAATAVRRELDVREPGGQGLPPERAARDARRPAPRLAPGRAPRPGRRRADVGQPVRLRAVPLPQRGRAAQPRHRPVLLPAQARGPRRGAPLERRVPRTRRTALGIPRGSIRATVLIETILAAFEMDEILHELREHAAGLNAGRWDYLFSAIKKFRVAGGPGPAGSRRS